MGSLYTIWTALVVATAAFSYVNFRFIKLPPAIGIMFLSLAFSLVLVFVGHFHPPFIHIPTRIIGSVDFESVLMKIMLSFLLFAGSIHLDMGQLKRESLPIAAFSTLGVLLSTAIMGALFYLAFQLLGMAIPVVYCFLLGALLSPTDPVAAMGILKSAKIPTSLETKITGESLFNDGVGVVVFITIMEVAMAGIANLSALQIGWLFLREAGGGVLWGLVLGYGGYFLLRSIDQHQVEVLITVALVMAGYNVANMLHVSGLLAMVVSGIVLGNKVRAGAMSPTARDYASKFWELIDEMLNAVLFMLIGFEMLLLSFKPPVIWAGLICILICLLARLVSVWVPAIIISFRRSFESSMIPVLTWGGLRGGISVALALSLPTSMHRNEFVPITYIVVVFSILVQGLTIGRLARRLNRKEA